MSLVSQIEDRVDDYLSGSYSIGEGYTIPMRQDLTFRKTAKKIQCKVFYADLRGSKQIVENHGCVPAIRIHKSFLYVVTKCVKHHNGYIRSFDGDSVLCFFKHNSPESAKDAVKAAMNIKAAMYEIVNPKVKDKYDLELDYGIGIGQGEVYVAKSGFQGDESYQDLIWIGWPTYVAHAFGDSAKSPKNIWISKHVYKHIEKYEEMIYCNGTNMWKESLESTAIGLRIVFKTSYYWNL